MRIVVVEDEDNTREGIIRLIRKIDNRYEVVGEADNGADGLEVIKKTTPDLVIADIKMPQLTGIEMLERLKESGFRHKSVILTGFSEFEYARKAIRMGVVEYLEKPVTADDIRTALAKIDNELAIEKWVGYPGGDPAVHAERLLARLSLQDGPEAAVTSKVEQAIGFEPNIPLQILSFYLGHDFETRRQSVRTEISRMPGPHRRLVLFDLPSDRSVTAVVQSGTPESEFGPMLRTVVVAAFGSWERKPVLCWGTIPDLSGLKDGLVRLKECRKWSIVLNQAQDLNDQVVREIQAKVLPYPATLENKAAAAISEGNRDEVRRIFRLWLEGCLADAYDPGHVIEASVRFVSSALRVLGEYHGDARSYDRQKEWLNALMEAQTKGELILAMETIAEGIVSDIENSLVALPHSPTLQKAIRMIKEHYQDGITLEEIASSLRITPEYLSSLFTKEVKKTYSSFIKEIRIHKAKELLLRSEMKTFEIAGKVGYPDAKYFSRVFKETTGLSPGEFQRLNKS
ncbi:response regulator [Cohnella sp. CFH 77786]|uniref:response regulator transcription factor n=1 Tax=Cohnella sp. CFH 77786 TaxID=2662265 RepID=UPI001C609CE3|nr:response regulator [Cohnella sp. CFH 77786]MBW5449256.1 response regulator [Cohnella sp. CFH 77786]